MKDYVKFNEKAYNNLASEYKNRIKKYKTVEKEIIRPFRDYLKENFDKISVLELGSGSGLSLFYLNQENFETTAIDISNEMIRVSKEMSPKTKFIHDDFLEHDFGDSKFQGIFAKAFIHLFQKKDAILVLKKIKNLLLPKGIAFISTNLSKKSREGYFEKKDYPGNPKRFRKKWTEEELIREVEKVGFKVFKKFHHKENEKNWIKLYVIKNNHFSK